MSFMVTAVLAVGETGKAASAMQSKCSRCVKGDGTIKMKSGNIVNKYVLCSILY